MVNRFLNVRVLYGEQVLESELSKFNCGTVHKMFTSQQQVLIYILPL